MRKTANYLNRNFKKERSDDILSTAKRSELMSKIRSRDTKFEKEFIVALRKFTRKSFQTNVSSIKGKPDIVFQKDKICVFLDSDFWHGWYYPKWKHLLKNDFWRNKIENNRKRDKRTSVNLNKQGWKVIRIWEHDIKNDFTTSIKKVIVFLK